MNRSIIGGGTVHDEFVVVPSPEGLVTIPDLSLDGELLDAVYRVSVEARSEESAQTKREVWAALHWHGRA